MLYQIRTLWSLKQGVADIWAGKNRARLPGGGLWILGQTKLLLISFKPLSTEETKGNGK
jgi:hypothetical protein